MISKLSDVTLGLQEIEALSKFRRDRPIQLEIFAMPGFSKG